jgi:hypothetical protein
MNRTDKITFKILANRIDRIFEFSKYYDINTKPMYRRIILPRIFSMLQIDALKFSLLALAL